MYSSVKWLSLSLLPSVVFVCKTSDLVTPDNGAVTISPPSLGDLEEDNYVNAVATFTCRDGYELSENVTRRCILNVGWDGTTPECTAGESNHTGIAIPLGLGL